MWRSILTFRFSQTRSLSPTKILRAIYWLIQRKFSLLPQVTHPIDHDLVAYADDTNFNKYFYYFSNCTTIVVCDENHEAVQIFLDAFKHFYYFKHEIKLIHYKDLNISENEFWARRDAFNKFKSTKHREWQYAQIKIKRCPTETITTSVIKSEIFEDREGDRKYRGLPSQLYNDLYKFVLSTPHVYDLGDTRKPVSSEVFIEKLTILYNSKFYIGSACGWTRWGMNVGTPTLILFYGNRLRLLARNFPETAHAVLHHVF